MDSRISAQWARVRGLLRAEVGDSSYRSWLKPLTLLGVDGNAVRIATPTRFMRDYVNENFAKRILELWTDENDAIETLDIEIQAEPAKRERKRRAATPARPSPQAAEPADEAPAAAAAGSGRAASERNGGDIGGPLDPRFVFDNFVVGKPNELAYAAARRVAESPTATYNPLFLYGGVGLGKTHLMHAIGWHIRGRHSNRRVVYLSAEKFMYQFIRALRFQDTMAFKEQFRSVDVLMIDDVQFINGKENTQEEFFHTFNDLVGNNRQVVVSADKSPSDLEGMEERLRSRLGWGLVADIHGTTTELRVGILQSKAEHLGVAVPPKVLEFLAHKITASVRELEGALNRIVAHSTLVGRDITLETCQEVLQDLLRAHERRVTIEEIQKRVAEHFNIRFADMHSARRSRAVARPRQVAMYLSKHLTSRSLPEIGRKFGGRDHTTVMYAVQKVEDLRQADPSFDEDVELLRRMLEA
ncbi:MAG: chromosomal replication initiator protein DnaA [Defluviicoccus sp.]|nr:chromosomal replication initiator protein DnaA [Defluviicoccus sp.]